MSISPQIIDRCFKRVAHIDTFVICVEILHLYRHERPDMLIDSAGFGGCYRFRRFSIAGRPVIRARAEAPLRPSRPRAQSTTQIVPREPRLLPRTHAWLHREGQAETKLIAGGTIGIKASGLGRELSNNLATSSDSPVTVIASPWVGKAPESQLGVRVSDKPVPSTGSVDLVLGRPPSATTNAGSS